MNTCASGTTGGSTGTATSTGTGTGASTNTSTGTTVAGQNAPIKASGRAVSSAVPTGQGAVPARKAGTGAGSSDSRHEKNVPRNAAAPYDLRVLLPALAAWGLAWLLTGLREREATPWAMTCLCACAGTALMTGTAMLRWRPPRHRADPRPGVRTDAAGMQHRGTLWATATLTAVTMGLIAGLCLLHAQLRLSDPVSRATSSHEQVTLIATVAAQPRRVGAQQERVITSLRVESVNSQPSHATVRVLGSTQWLSFPLGQRLRVTTSLRPADRGQEALGVIHGRARITPLAQPQGRLGAVLHIRRALTSTLAQVPRAPWGGPWPQGARGLIPGMTVGDTSALDPSTREAMRATSLTHLTAVSGQHMGVIVGITLLLGGALPRVWRIGVAGIVILLMVGVVGAQASVLRASMMGAIMLLSFIWGRPRSSLAALGMAVIVMLMAQPWQSHSWAMLLSVTATAGIIVGEPLLRTALCRRIPRWCAVLISVPASAQLSCAPVVAMLTGTVTPWALLANIAVLPAVVPALVGGLSCACLSVLPPFVLPGITDGAAAVCAWVALLAGSWIVGLARGVASLPGVTLTWPDGPAGFISLALIHAGLLMLCSRRGRHILRRALSVTWWEMQRRGYQLCFHMRRLL